MKKLGATLVLVLVILGLMTIVIISSRKNNELPSVSLEADQSSVVVEDMDVDILYWGTTCPHCHDTINWIEQNKIEDKLKIVRKEVYNNQTNSIELSTKAKSCGLDEANVGVPFMYTNKGDCLIGTPDITDYLDKKVNQEATSIDNDSASASAQQGGLE